MKHIVHIIPSLQRGGAEHTLMRLVTHTNPKLVQHSIICLKEEGDLLEDLRPHLKHFMVIQGYPWRFFQLVKLLKQWRPDIVQTWMYHSNVLGGIAAKLAKVKKIFWNIRITKLEWGYHSLNSFIFYKLGSWTSNFIPQQIIYCSKSGVTFHEGQGYSKKKSFFIPNGLDIVECKNTEKQKSTARSELHIDKNAFVIGMLARFHPQKDFQTFFKAAEIFLKQHPTTKFILAGHQITQNNTALLDLIPPSIRQNVELLGNHSEVKNVFACMDVFTLASMAEGFPNVVAEAMACGVPAVASDVGDAKLIIGNTGWIVPPRDPEALAQSWAKAIKSDLKLKGKAAQERIQENFSLQRMTDVYTKLYLKD